MRNMKLCKTTYETEFVYLKIDQGPIICEEHKQDIAFLLKVVQYLPFSSSPHLIPHSISGCGSDGDDFRKEN